MITEKKTNEELERIIENEDNETFRIEYFKILLNQIKPNEYYFKYIENLLISDTNYWIRRFCIKYLIKNFKKKKCILPINYALKNDFDLVKIILKNNANLVKKIENYLTDDYLSLIFTKNSFLISHHFDTSNGYYFRKNLLRNEDLTIEITDMNIELTHSSILKEFNKKELLEFKKISQTDNIILFNKFNNEDCCGVYYTVPCNTIYFINQLIDLNSTKFIFLEHIYYTKHFCLIAFPNKSKIKILMLPDILEFNETKYQKVTLENVHLSI